jgi:hypothetical protein
MIALRSGMETIMGIGMSDVEYIVDKGYLPAESARLLDIGSQNIMNVSAAAVVKMARHFGNAMPEPDLAKEADRLSYFSSPRPGEQTTYLSEIFDLTPNAFYTSYDVCPGLKTELFDLNTDDLPVSYRGSFDVVLNCGTTEHVTNQINSFKVIHEATKVGGIMLHQMPSVGWLNHGYYTYHPAFFDDLAHANGYEVVDRWYVAERIMTVDTDVIDVRSAYSPQVPRSQPTDGLLLNVQCLNLNVVLRKHHDQPFRVKLELETSHAAPNSAIQSKYVPSMPKSGLTARVAAKISRMMS